MTFKKLGSIPETRFHSEEETAMRTNSKFASWVVALALALVIVLGAAAQCGLSMKAIKPSGWQPEYGEAYQRMVLVDKHDGQEASIVGMWHVIFTAQTMNGRRFPE
ncbi:MAG: hypothetical protein WCA20_16665 [Candidatus Sulfotelmatobacter sp.]